MTKYNIWFLSVAMHRRYAFRPLHDRRTMIVASVCTDPRVGSHLYDIHPTKRLLSKPHQSRQQCPMLENAKNCGKQRATFPSRLCAHPCVFFHTSNRATPIFTQIRILFGNLDPPQLPGLHNQLSAFRRRRRGYAGRSRGRYRARSCRAWRSPIAAFLDYDLRLRLSFGCGSTSEVRGRRRLQWEVETIDSCLYWVPVLSKPQAPPVAIDK